MLATLYAHAEHEAEMLRLYEQDLAKARNEAARKLQADNLKLFEKIKFLQQQAEMLECAASCSMRCLYSRWTPQCWSGNVSTC